MDDNTIKVIKDIFDSEKKDRTFSYTYKHAIISGRMYGLSKKVYVKILAVRIFGFDLKNNQYILVGHNKNDIPAIDEKTTYIYIGSIYKECIQPDLVAFKQFQALLTYLDKPLCASDLDEISAIIRSRKCGVYLITYYGYRVLGEYNTNNGMKDTFKITQIVKVDNEQSIVLPLMKLYIPKGIYELSDLFNYLRERACIINKSDNSDSDNDSDNDSESDTDSKSVDNPEVSSIDMTEISKDIIQSMYDNNHNFIYHLNGYRIVGQIKLYNSENVDPDNITINITRVINPNLEIIPICNCDDYTINGRATHTDECSYNIPVNYMANITCFESLFESIINKPKYEINLKDFKSLCLERRKPNALTEKENMIDIKYRNSLLAVDVSNADVDDVKIIEVNSTDNSHDYGIEFWNKKTSVKGYNVMIQDNHESGLNKYKDLFTWIDDQYILKKIKTIENATNNIQNMRLQYEEYQEKVSDLENQISALNEELKTASSDMKQKKVMLDSYIELVNLVK